MRTFIITRKISYSAKEAKINLFLRDCYKKNKMLRFYKITNLLTYGAFKYEKNLAREVGIQCLRAFFIFKNA